MMFGFLSFACVLLMVVGTSIRRSSDYQNFPVGLDSGGTTWYDQTAKESPSDNDELPAIVSEYVSLEGADNFNRYRREAPKLKGKTGRAIDVSKLKGKISSTIEKAPPLGKNEGSGRSFPPKAILDSSLDKIKDKMTEVGNAIKKISG